MHNLADERQMRDKGGAGFWRHVPFQPCGKPPVTRLNLKMVYALHRISILFENMRLMLVKIGSFGNAGAYHLNLMKKPAGTGGLWT